MMLLPKYAGLLADRDRLHRRDDRRVAGREHVEVARRRDARAVIEASVVRRDVVAGPRARDRHERRPGTWTRLADSADNDESSRASTVVPSAPATIVVPVIVAIVSPVTAFVTSFAVAP